MKILKTFFNCPFSPHLNCYLFDLHILLAALALTGISVSGFVYLSVKAASIAIHELESRWLELNPSCKPIAEFRWPAWLKAFIKGHDTTYKTHEASPTGLPGVIGGGHPAANWLGFHAPSGLPLCIIGVWVFLLIDTLLDLR